VAIHGSQHTNDDKCNHRVNSGFNHSSLVNSSLLRDWDDILQMDSAPQKSSVCKYTTPSSIEQLKPLQPPRNPPCPARTARQHRLILSAQHEQVCERDCGIRAEFDDVLIGSVFKPEKIVEPVFFPSGRTPMRPPLPRITKDSELGSGEVSLGQLLDGSSSRPGEMIFASTSFFTAEELSALSPSLSSLQTHCFGREIRSKVRHPTCGRSIPKRMSSACD
jgi:hypothetical protein